MRKLIPVGTRVRCGEAHRGVLAGYFVAEGDWISEHETHLYGVIRLDNGYWAKADGEEEVVAFTTMLVVHTDNLNREED